MKKLTTSELRKAFLDFFVSKSHRLIKSDSVVATNDPSVLFTSAGMNPFKDYFLGKAKDFQRATSCQKCFRTGDLKQAGQTPYHHTFFEMLGNFSFGDYFKKETIVWAWEFVTEVLEIDKKRLWVSVYEDDGEAWNLWKQAIGLAAAKIKKFGQKENFWPSNAITEGPNGPCGPCSEIYYEKDNGESVELWNLVFTQFDRREEGILEPLPNKNIDTGMGLERMSSVLQGVDSNFKIDIFVPIVEAVKKSIERREEKLEFTIADHVRAVAFCICDGVLPSNDGRGYVIRKLIRRCLYLTQMQDPKPFLYKIVSSVAEAMRDQYPELLERRDNISQIMKAEEEKCIKNILEGGSERLSEQIDLVKKSGKFEFPAETVADLYMTHGIPVEFTLEALNKANLSTNTNYAFEIIKLEQDKARDSSKMAGQIFSKGKVQLKKTTFVGYESDSCQAQIIQIVKEDQEVACIDSEFIYGVVLDKTPFYAESGGQVGDKGYIEIGNRKLLVTDAVKQGDSIIHFVMVRYPLSDSIQVGDKVVASVDVNYREAVKRAHTATHVLQAVLRQVLGPHVQQAGSYVEPDRFRFDFTHFKNINAEEMERIKELLNVTVLKNDPLKAEVMSKVEAQKTGAIALFGEKYEDIVRVVSIADYSKEFCGGTHAAFTGQIGSILITSESSVGSGLRRIEALTGQEAFRKIQESLEILDQVSALAKVQPAQTPSVLEATIVKMKALEKENLQLREKGLKEEIEEIAKTGHKIKDVSLFIHKFKNFDVNLLRSSVDLLRAEVVKAGVFFLASVQESNATFVCGLTKDLVDRGFSADAFIKKILPMVGGSGGGRKDFAQGGTKEISKVDTALSSFEKIVKEEV